MKLTILFGSTRVLLALLVGSSVLGFGVLFVQGQWGLRSLEQSAVHMAEAKDIVADILPPPLYLVEAHLLVQQCMAAPRQERADLARGFALLKTRYDDSNRLWQDKQAELAPEVTAALFGLQKVKADAYWALLQHDFIPAVLDGRIQDARKLLEQLDHLYLDHRDGVNLTVIVARRWGDQRLAEFAAIQSRTLWLLTAVTLACVLAGLVTYAAVARRVANLLGAEPEVLRNEMQRIASGDLTPSGREAHQGSVFSAIKLAQENLHAHVERTEQTNRNLQITLSELNRLVGTDLLTGLWNRRHLEEAMLQELDRHRRYRQPLSILLIDLDFFKAVNDLCGHAAGDQVLLEVAKRIQLSLRHSDALARWGGEEFVVLCPNTTLGTVAKLAERLREQISQTVMPQGLHLTASLGVAEAGLNETWPELFDRLDRALYRAKQEGRNRVYYAEETPAR